MINKISGAVAEALAPFFNLVYFVGMACGLVTPRFMAINAVL